MIFFMQSCTKEPSSNDIDDVVNDEVEGNIGTVVAYVEGMEDKDPNFLIDVQAIKDFKFDFTVKTETPTYEVQEVLYCRRKIINSSGFSIR